VLGLAGVLMIALRGGSDDVCMGAERSLAGVWDPARSAEIERAFARTKAPYAMDGFRAVARRLDDYTAAWVAMKTDACEATHVRREQIEEHQGLRNVCLDERLAVVRALTSLLAKADEGVVKNAVRAASALESLAPCADLRALTARVPPPVDTGTRVRVEAMRTRLADVRVQGEAGRYKEAAAAAATLATEAATIGYRPLHAEVLLLAGALEERAGNPKQAEQHLVQAVQAAAAGRDDRTVAEAWIHLVRVLGLGLTRKEEALTTIGHATAALERIGGDPLEQAALDLYAGLILEEFGKFTEARVKYQQALDTRTKLLPADHLDIANALTQLGLVDNELNNLQDSRTHLERALAIREKALGPNHPEVASAVHNLGNVQFGLGDIVAAEGSFRRGLAIREQSLEADHPELAKSLVNLAVVQRHQRNYADAIALLRRALAINEKRLGADHPGLASTLYNLSTVYLVEEKWAEAAVPLERGLAIMTKARGAEHPDIAAFLGTLGQIYGGQKRWDQALATIQRALAIDIKAFGPEHPNVAADHDQIGGLYLHQGKHTDALDAYRRGLAIKEKSLGKDHAELAIPLSNIGRALRSLGRDKEAVEAYARAVAIDERTLGKDHPDLVFSLAGLGELSRKLGKLDEASTFLERALALRDVKVHVQALAQVKWSLAQALWDRKGDRARARKLATEARIDFEQRGDKGGLAAIDRWLATHR
jgi:serine/threonine-protein kinase